MEPQPAYTRQAGQGFKQISQPPFSIQVYAVISQVLRNEADFAHPFVNQAASFFHNVLEGA